MWPMARPSTRRRNSGHHGRRPGCRNNSLAPEKNRTVELGTKWELLDQRRRWAARCSSGQDQCPRSAGRWQLPARRRPAREGPGAEPVRQGHAAVGRVRQLHLHGQRNTPVDHPAAAHRPRPGQHAAQLLQPVDHLCPARRLDGRLWRARRGHAQRHLAGRRQARRLLGPQRDGVLRREPQPQAAAQRREPDRQGLRRTRAPVVGNESRSSAIEYGDGRSAMLSAIYKF